MANHPHIRGANAELPSQFCIADSGFGALANVEDVQAGELGHCMALACGVLASASVGCVSVPHVVGVAEPLKVLGAVVSPVEVFVVDGLGRVRSGAEEGFSYQPMHPRQNLRTTTTEVEAWVSGTERSGEDAPSRTATVALDSVETADAPKVRNFIQTFVTDYCAPLFCGRIFTSHRVPFAGLRSGL